MDAAVIRPGLVARLARGLRDARWLLRLPAADRHLIAAVRARHLTYLAPARLASLASTCRQVEANGVRGDFLEAGCALGGSTIVIARTKSPERRLRVYDVFGQIPPPGPKDPPEVHARFRTIVSGRATGIGGTPYYGYQPDLQGVVLANLSEFGVDPANHSVALIAGPVAETLHVDSPVAFAHIDLDWYESVATALDRILPRLSPGGAVIVDDYHDWAGCKAAVDEAATARPEGLRLDSRAGAMRILRLAEVDNAPARELA